MSICMCIFAFEYIYNIYIHIYMYIYIYVYTHSGQCLSRVAGSLASCFSIRIWYVFLTSKCRGELDLGLCMTLVLAKRMWLHRADFQFENVFGRKIFGCYPSRQINWILGMWLLSAKNWILGMWPLDTPGTSISADNLILHETLSRFCLYLFIFITLITHFPTQI